LGLRRLRGLSAQSPFHFRMPPPRGR
jgi:hypothetical protein